MKTKILILTLILCTIAINAYTQSLRVSPELKELIGLSINKDYKLADKNIDKKFAVEQQKAIRSAYLPKVELGGKYAFGYSTINSKIAEIEGFESISKLREFMLNPAFPVLFPSLASLSSEITQLQQLMAQQGMTFPSVSNNLEGTLYGNYFGIDATAKILLYSGGQVPNTSKALGEKIKIQEALADKCSSDVISEVISCYDQLAVLDQSKHVLDESVLRLQAEKKYAGSALKNGMATSFDTLKIAVAEANLQARISDYESKRTLLHQKLSQLTGKPAAGFESCHPELDLLLYADTSTDISKRAELRALTAGAEAKKYLFKAEKSHYLPKLQALATVRYDNIFKSTADFNAPIPMNIKIDNMGMGPTVMLGAGFKWEIFDRSGGTSREHLAALEVKKAENAINEARELLELNQIRAISAYQAAISQLAYKDKQRQAAQKALDLAEKSYSQGMLNITERLATETEAQNAELEYLQAIFVQRQAALECFKATGNLQISNIQ